MTHKSSVEAFRYFNEKYLGGKITTPIVYEIGAGQKTEYRNLLEDVTYLSVDIEPPADIVLTNSYHWAEIGDEVADIVICGQVMEHVRYPWLTIREIARIMKHGGLCFIIAPSRGPLHPHPKDCWRFMPDGMESLLMWADIDVLEYGISPFAQEDDKWGDCYAIGRKI